MDKNMDSSAVVDMEALEGDESDYDDNFADVKYEEPHIRLKDPDSDDQQASGGNFKDEMTKGMAAYMFQSGKERAKRAFNIYGNIDVLRPYFDVEPYEVRERLLYSLIPQRPSSDYRQKVARELYGPLMVVFTLIALLLFQMKMSDHTVQEGTLMGSAFGVCFGYWFGISSLVWVMAYVCNTHITMLQVLSMIGYALFGHCVVLFISTVFHTSHDHAMFYIMWAIFGGLSTLKMVSVLASRTTGQTQKLIVCGTVAAVHLLFLLYLHFAYHQIVEDLSDALGGDSVPRMHQETGVEDGGEVDDSVAHEMANKMGETAEEAGRAIRSASNDLLPAIKRNLTEIAAQTNHRLADNAANIVNNNPVAAQRMMPNVMNNNLPNMVNNNAPQGGPPNMMNNNAQLLPNMANNHPAAAAVQNMAQAIGKNITQNGPGMINRLIANNGTRLLENGSKLLERIKPVA